MWRVGDLGSSLKPVLQSNEEGQRVVFDVEQSMSRTANSGSQLKRQRCRGDRPIE